MAERNQEEQWRRADDEVRKKLPPGVKLVRTLRGHTDWIGRIAWSPDGRMLASPSADKTIRLWDAETGGCLRTLLISGSGYWTPRLGEGRVGAAPYVSFPPDSRWVATGDDGGKVNLWNTADGRLMRTIKVGIYDEVGISIRALGWSQNGETLAFSKGKVIYLSDPKNDRQAVELGSHAGNITSIAWAPYGPMLATASWDTTVGLWDTSRRQMLRDFRGHTDSLLSLAWGNLQQGPFLFSAGYDGTIRVWEVASGRQTGIIEGHTSWVPEIGVSSNGRLLASRAARKDGTLQLWRCDTWESVAVIPALNMCDLKLGLAFHPTLPILATVGSAPDVPEQYAAIYLLEFDIDLLLKKVARVTRFKPVHYVNAKIVVVGDSGVGKTGLSWVLNNRPYMETDSTSGRHVWTFDSREVSVSGNVTQTRETLLWDLAGQPGYRVIHQLHLNEVAVALVVFDARSETDPLAGVRHWERALRLAQQRQGSSGVPMKKFLVSARNDRGGVSIGEDRVRKILDEFGFDGYFKTSAKEGWEIRVLRAAIEQAIEWEKLPEVSSSQLFADIKSFLLDVKKTGRLLVPASQLYDEFVRQYRKGGAGDSPSGTGAMPQGGKSACKLLTSPSVPSGGSPDGTGGSPVLPNEDLRPQFETCIGRLETRDLIRRLTFGGCVLLQPELLDAYGSAMVNTAKEEPDGLGSMAEEIALAGKFYVPKEQKVTDPGQEQLLLHATVEELVRHDLALRENADDGRYLVFPSQFNRDYEDAPEPKGKAVAITFDGPVQSLYSTLAVRLGHSGLFTTGRAEMWRNAAVFSAKAGGKCGLFVHEFAEGRGRLILFFPDEHSSAETRFHFEEFVLAHARRRALDESVKLVRFFVCPKCNTPVPDAYVEMLRAQGQSTFNCFCPGKGVVSLAEPKERIHFRSKVEAMEQSADRQRDFDAFVMSAKGETSTKSFQEWAGGQRVTLGIVFTDVVGSTALGEDIRDEAMNEVRRTHFAQSRRLIGQFKGREIKTIGDSFMVAFKCTDAALDYAMALQKNTGHPQVRIRAGIHIGPIRVEEGDVFGGTVNFAARVIGAIKDAEIWVSDRAKEDVDRLGAGKHKALKWERHEGVAMKGFPGKFTLWELKRVGQSTAP